MPIFTENKKTKLRIDDRKIKKVFFKNKKIYSSGNICTYHVDDGQVYTEEIDEDASCLAPKSFTPTKSGWTFAGWREDRQANGAVINVLTMKDTPVTLYAVFQQTITLSYSGNGNTGGATAAQTGTKYWNTGNVLNPSFTLSANGFTKTNYTFHVWASESTDGIQYTAGTNVTLSANTTMFALWLGNPWYLTPLNSVTWIFSQPNGPGEYKYAADSTEVRVFAKKTAGNYAYGRMTAKIPTKGCKKCRIKYLINSGWNGGGGSISGISGDVRGEGYSYLSGLGDTVSIYIQANDATEYFTCAAYIKEIYFYN